MLLLHCLCFSVFCHDRNSCPAFFRSAKKLRLFLKQCHGQRSQVRRIPSLMIQICQHGQPLSPFLLF